MYRYSDRFHWTAAANLFSSLLCEIRQQGSPLLDLTVSNPTEAFSDYPHAEISAALSSIKSFVYQPEPLGNHDARTAIARRMSGISPSQIALTASTSEAYSLLFKLLANPGDEILAPTPSYPLFDYLAQLESVRLRPYRLAYDGSWHVDFESLEGAISARTRAVILVNPNNPTGSFLKVPEWLRLRDLAMTHSLPLISDEVFMDYTFGQASQRGETLTGQNDVLSFALNGLSKACGMPQMKLGWIVVNGPPDERQRACARLELLLDTYLSVSAPVQLATEQLLETGDKIQRSIRRRLQRNFAALNGFLRDAQVHMLHMEGGWSAVLRVPKILTEEEWITRLLREQSVIVQPGYFFDMPGEAFLVVSLLTPEETFSSGITRLLALTQAF